MDKLDRPPLDQYDKAGSLPPNFTRTPELQCVGEIYLMGGTKEQGKYWSAMEEIMDEKIQLIYMNKGICKPGRFGLYFVGSKDELLDENCERIMVLVFEMLVSEVSRWIEVDSDLKAMMEGEGLTSERGISIRYYHADPNITAEDVPVSEWEQSRAFRVSQGIPPGRTIPTLPEIKSTRPDGGPFDLRDANIDAAWEEVSEAFRKETAERRARSRDF